MKKTSLTIICLLIAFSSYSQEIISPKLTSEYINGRLMKTIEDKNLIVSTSLKSISRDDGKYYIFDVYITNKSFSKTVMIKNFKASIFKKKKVYEGEILTRKEYIKIKKRRAALRAALVSAAGGLAAEAAGTKTKEESSYSSGSVNTNISGNSNSQSDVYNSSGLYSGSVDTNTSFNGNATSNYYSNSTTYSTERDGAAVAAAQRQNQNDVNQMIMNANEARSKWNESYIANNTLKMGETMSGLLNVKYKKGDKIVLNIIVENLEYPFEWNPDESED